MTIDIVCDWLYLIIHLSTLFSASFSLFCLRVAMLLVVAAAFERIADCKTICGSASSPFTTFTSFM